MPRLTTLSPRLKVAPSRLTASSGTWRAGKETASQRGYTYAWRKARLVHLDANPLCVYCQRKGRVTAAEVVDHKVPHRGDMTLFWDRTNWQSLCTPCHSAIKQREEAKTPFS